MKLSHWISENKILVFIPLLALFVAGVFVLAYNHAGNAGNADQAATASYPTPTIVTADPPAAGTQESQAQTAEPAAVDQLAPDTAKVIFQVDGMSCSGCIATIKSSLKITLAVSGAS